MQKLTDVNNATKLMDVSSIFGTEPEPLHFNIHTSVTILMLIF
jgi:hypothetical protein